MAAPPSRRVTISPLNEYRFELEKDEAISIRLVEGTAEIFGYELAFAVPNPFSDECRAAVFTWKGATIEVTGKVSTDYVAEETPVPTYLNLHLALQKIRLQARPPGPGRDEIPGPRVMVVGGAGSGKTTLVKSLINWSARQNRAGNEKENGVEILVGNLDTGDGAFTVPGTISLATIRDPIPTTTPVHVLGTTLTTGLPVITETSSLSSNSDEYKPTINHDLFAPFLSALTFFYGNFRFGGNATLAEMLLKKAGKLATTKLEDSGDEGLWKGGLLLDTGEEMAERKNGQMVSRAVREFGITTLVVVGDEKLHIEMSRLLSTNKSVTIVRVPKSGGSSEPSAAQRTIQRDRQIRSYFHGGPRVSLGQLSPFLNTVKFDDLKIYRIGADAMAPTDALPIGATSVISEIQLSERDPLMCRPSELLNRVLAILQVPDDAPDEEKIQSPVLGFVHIAKVDVAKKQYSILAPTRGRLPRKTALLAEIEWQDVL